MIILESSSYFNDWLQENEDDETDKTFEEWMKIYHPTVDMKEFTRIKDSKEYD